MYFVVYPKWKVIKKFLYTVCVNYLQKLVKFVTWSVQYEYLV